MNFIGMVFVLFMSFVVIVMLVAMLLALVRRAKGISKDYAQSIAMRRYGQGQPIGARFTRVGRKWIWEFDIRDGEAIHRIWIDARAGTLLKAVDVSQSAGYARPPSLTLGKRIG